MIDLILTSPAGGPASLFTRNFRVHSGIPIGLYEGGPCSPCALIYGEISDDILREFGDYYRSLIAIPSVADDEIPPHPAHYETMTVKAPILASIQNMGRPGFEPFIGTFEGAPLILEGMSGGAYTLIFTADLVKSTIRILSGELEQHTGSDEHGRPNPPPEYVTETPAVSLHFNLIEQAVRHVYKRIEEPLFSIPRWPSSAPMAVFLSHDVDVVKKWTIKRVAYESMRALGNMLRFNFGETVKIINGLSSAIEGKDPYWDFNELIFLEGSNGFSSTWFFAPFGGEYTSRTNPIDPVYRRRSSEITSVIRKLYENDCEIALHGTRSAYNNTDELKRQLASFEERLGFRLNGVRHHYLMFDRDATFEATAKAGLAYDATLGFSDRAGFRNGMASPFFPCNTDETAGSVIEIPLMFMDTMFLHAKSGVDTAKRKVTEAYLYAKAAGGLFSMLIHPGNMDESEIPDLAHFYHSLVPRCCLDKALSMNAAELTRWWLARERVLRSIEIGSNVWRIQGIDLPPDMDFAISAPNIKFMKFSIEGARGASELSHDRLTIRPGSVETSRGITFIRKG